VPAFKGTGKRALIRIAKRKGNLGNTQTAIRQIAQGDFKAHLLQDIQEIGISVREPALQYAPRDIKLVGQLIYSYLTLRQVLHNQKWIKRC